MNKYTVTIHFALDDMDRVVEASSEVEAVEIIKQWFADRGLSLYCDYCKDGKITFDAKLTN
jgi:hypothetical protein